MINKELHIIPHTHWDREWYMSFEEHRYHLVELLDTLIETMEQNPDYRYFHLDGQMIVLDDYLEIKPYMRERLLRLIRDGRIQVGPFYMLQDEFLISGEANVRNVLYGFKKSREYGVEPVKIGYFPDTFGNISQMPQILNGFDIYEAVVGRGLNEMSADNTVTGQDKRLQSEMFWESPDKSKILGVFYLNWYHNAYELPIDKKQAKERIETLIRTTSEFAATPYLLGMNGCDHQPVQTNLPEALEVAKETVDDIKILIGNFPDYFEKIKPYSSGFKTVSGELTGKHTKGWERLINTASSRIPLKIYNHTVQNLLERGAEPLDLISGLYDGVCQQDFLNYAWKTLMQNHPHDSICCCSVDAVADEMETRFHKSEQTARCVVKEAFDNLAVKINTSQLSEQNIVVFNKEQTAFSGVVTGVADFSEKQERELCLFDSDGHPVEAIFEHIGDTFTYTLPKDHFRERQIVDRYQVTFRAEQIPALGYACFTVKQGKAACTTLEENNAVLENEWIKAVVEENGTLTVTDKLNGHQYRDFNYFEDAGDGGNLYNYQPVGMARNTLLSRPSIEVTAANSLYKTVKVTHTIQSPACVMDGKESEEFSESKISSFITLEQGANRLDIRTVIDNHACDHRIRACFDTSMDTNQVYADGQFDVVERDIIPWEGWENPVLTERMQSFFELTDGNKGVLIASKGLHEYEILAEKRTMALTLMRAVGEVGDWGYFPTPKAELQGEITLEYAIILHQGENQAEAYRTARAFSNSPFVLCSVGKHIGVLPLKKSFFALEGDYLQISALKRREDQEGGILRFYNSSFQEQKAVVSVPASYKRAFLCKLNEQEETELKINNGRISLVVAPKKIVTISLR